MEVSKSLRRHYEGDQKIGSQGTYFFDYGNAFMKSVFDAGVTEISKNGYDDKDGFIWPSYVKDIMGPELFDYGYGPFRWVCLSGKHEDLVKTDHAAMACINRIVELRIETIGYGSVMQKKNQLVVGTQLTHPPVRMP